LLALKNTKRTLKLTVSDMRRKAKMAKTTNAVEILKRTTGIDPNTDPGMLKISEDFRVAQMIYDARTNAGLTQSQLAKRVETTQSVISQLEDADYDGHSLSMLRRVAAALESHVEVRIVPNEAAEPVTG
jgi:ribosome-binding protein aMBF1 (putative translation factor)